MRRALWILAALAGAGCAPTKVLPVLGQVPPFELTAHTGAPFGSKDLAGKIWVADFIFTNCSGPCPRMSAKMRRVQASVEGLGDVRLVSFTADPKRDTPEVLAAYARLFHVKQNFWFFLTGPFETLQVLSRDAFKLTSLDADLTHSTRFVAVDRHARIRGYYLSSDEGSIRELIADIRRLEKEPR